MLYLLSICPMQLLRYIVTNSHSKGGNIQKRAKETPVIGVGLWHPQQLKYWSWETPTLCSCLQAINVKCLACTTIVLGLYSQPLYHPCSFHGLFFNVILAIVIMANKSYIWWDNDVRFVLGHLAGQDLCSVIALKQ